MTATLDVVFEEMQGVDGDLGIITLNRPTVLNALNFTMVQAIHRQLKSWSNASNIKAVVIRAAEGRAFCAGGDLRPMYEGFKQHDPALALFFRHEYQLNRAIFHFPKPYIALLDGITMGGGVGISIHGSHRVATERLMFAMPETGIGFFPDVGGTYFLPRLPRKVGTYLALTGAKLLSDDCVAMGIAQHKVSQANLPALLDALANRSYHGNAHQAVTEIITSFQTAVSPFSLQQQQSCLDECLSYDTIEQINDALSSSSHDICRNTHAIIMKKSPTSLKVTLRALLDGKRMDFDACMQQEFRLASRFLQGHDFAEGIRAVIVDKDQSPQWQPATIAAVTSGMVDDYFAPLPEELVQQ